jgi:hypothetical protein
MPNPVIKSIIIENDFEVEDPKEKNKAISDFYLKLLTSGND